MKILLVIFMISNGVDYGPPRPIEMPSIEACQKSRDEVIAAGIPDGIQVMRVGCEIQISGESI